MTKVKIIFENISKYVSQWASSSSAFVFALLLIIVWLSVGPYYNWSDSHSLFVNTVTTIVTFLTVFLLQRSQSKDSIAIQMKLNELIASMEGASNRLLNVENLTEHEIELLRRRYKSLGERTKHEDNKTTRHTVEEIED